MSNKLALLGGKPIIDKNFDDYNTIGEEEKKAVMEVLDAGKLSDFLGSASDGFNGGKWVRAIEKSWCEYFDVKIGRAHV